MRKFLSGLALAALAGGAHAALQFSASSVLDTATGLTWSYLTPVVVGSAPPPLSTFTNRSDGQRLATSEELLTFFADAGLSPLSGTFVFPNEPNGVEALRTWSQGAVPSGSRQSTASFIFAGDQPGFVGTGSYNIIFTGTLDTYSYSASVSSVFSQYPAYPVNAQFGAALVTAAIPEPSAYLLLTLGIGFFGIVRRRGQPLTQEPARPPQS